MPQLKAARTSEATMTSVALYPIVTISEAVATSIRPHPEYRKLDDLRRRATSKRSSATRSDTTLRTRRDEWINAGVFDQFKTEALARQSGAVAPTYACLA
jgi:hypothetical protein